MLTQVEVFGAQATIPALTLPLHSEIASSPIQIKGIDGLEPVKAVLNSSPYGTYDGETYLGSSIGKRNIVMSFGLNPDWALETMEELRMELYKFFMPQQAVGLRFTSTHLPMCQIVGYVESLNPNIFSKDPEIQVSILCFNPDFIAIEPTDVSGSAHESPLAFTVDYAGNVPTGFMLTLMSTGGVGEGAINIVNDTLEHEEVHARGVLNSSYRYEMNTVPGDKFLQSVHILSGIVTNYLWSVAPGAVWPKLHPGENNFLITSTVSASWTISYFDRFGGL